MFKLVDVDILLMSKISTFKAKLDSNPFSSETELTRVSIELFETFHTYICEMSITKAILNERQKSKIIKSDLQIIQSYIELLSQQEKSYLELPWQSVTASMSQSQAVVIGLKSIIQDSHFKEFLDTAYRAVTCASSIQALFSGQKEIEDPKIVALLPRLPTYLVSTQSTKFGIASQVSEPLKLLGRLNVFVQKFQDILTKGTDGNGLKPDMITVTSQIYAVLLSKSAEFKDLENELRISEMVDKALKTTGETPQTNALRAILAQHFSNPLQKSLTKPEEGNVFLRTILAKAYPSEFQMEGKLVAPKSQYNKGKFPDLLNEAFGWSRAGNTSIQPNQLDGMAFGKLFAMDKDNLLWLVLQASAPCNAGFDAQQKLLVYVRLAEKFKAEKIGKHHKAAQAFQLALLPAIALVKANQQLEPIFQDNFGQKSMLGKWLSTDKGSNQQYPIALQSLSSDSALVIETDRLSQLSNTKEDTSSLSASEPQTASASAFLPQALNVDSEGDDDHDSVSGSSWDRFTEDDFSETEELSPPLEEKTNWEPLARQYYDHILDLETQIQVLQDKLPDLVDEVIQQTGSIEEHNKVIQSHQTQIQSLEKSLTIAQSQVEQERISFSNTIQQLQEQNNQLSAEKANHATALEEARQQGVTQQASADAVTIQDLQKQISTLQQEKQGLQAENVQLKSQIAKSSLTDKQVVDILVLCTSLENEEKGFVGGFFAKRKQAKRVVLNALVENCKTKPIADALREVQSQFPVQYAEALKGRHSRTREILEDIRVQTSPVTDASSPF